MARGGTFEIADLRAAWKSGKVPAGWLSKFPADVQAMITGKGKPARAGSRKEKGSGVKEWFVSFYSKRHKKKLALPFPIVADTKRDAIAEGKARQSGSQSDYINWTATVTNPYTKAIPVLLAEHARRDHRSYVAGCPECFRQGRSNPTAKKAKKKTIARVNPLGLKFSPHAVTSGKQKARVSYSPEANAIFIYAKDFESGDALGRMMPDRYTNNTDSQTDYFEKGRVILRKGDPRYDAAMAAIGKRAGAPFKPFIVKGREVSLLVEKDDSRHGPVFRIFSLSPSGAKYGEVAARLTAAGAKKWARSNIRRFQRNTAKKAKQNTRPLFCADCDRELKADAAQMNDRRWVCPSCKRKAGAKAQAKRAPRLFEDQSLLFENPKGDKLCVIVKPTAKRNPRIVRFKQSGKQGVSLRDLKEAADNGEKWAQRSYKIALESLRRIRQDEKAAKRNVEMGYFDRFRVFHPIRKSKDYNEFRGGDVDSHAEKRARQQRYDETHKVREYYEQEEKREAMEFAKRLKKQHKSLAQFVRGQGGIAYKPRQKGSRGDDLRSKGGHATELGMLSPRETGTTGLLNKTNRQGSQRYGAEYMMDAANAEGYRDRSGRPWENIGDFLADVADDASGLRKFYNMEALSNPEYKVKGSRPHVKIDGIDYEILVRHTPAEHESAGRDATARLMREKKIVADLWLKRPKGGAVFIANEYARGHSKPRMIPGNFGFSEKNPHAARSFTVTPARARHWLKTYAGPKTPMVQSRVGAIARDMKAGTYMPKSPIKFREGKLFDGRHRLQGIVRSGVTIEMPIERVQKNPLHPLEIVSHVAAGIMGVQSAVQLRRDLKRKRPKKNPAELVGAIVQGAGFTIGAGAIAAAAAAASHTKVGRSIRRALTPAKKNPEVPPNTPANEKIRSDFLGRKGTGKAMMLYTPPGSPKAAGCLAKLTALRLKRNGKKQHFPIGSAFIGGIQRGDWRRMVIGLKQPFAAPNGIDPDKAIDYGEVDLIEYVARKPHLYGRNSPEYPFYHELGEEGGRLPHLIMQNGCLALRGGSYGIKREGINN